jgi:hypothetical protein
MKVGDMVRNVGSVRTNGAVNENRGWKPIGPGYVGIVLGVRPDTLNNPPLFDYVDVLLSVGGAPIRCGNYAASTFEVLA